MKKGTGKSFYSMREKVIQRDKEKCVHCSMSREDHRKKYKRDICVDHIDSQQSNNTMANLQTLCFGCNARKGNSKIKDKRDELSIAKVRVYPSSRKQLRIIAARFDSTIAEIIACMLALEKRDKNLVPLGGRPKTKAI